jgi:hypothetical protein
VTAELPGLRAAPAAADGISPRFAALLAEYGAGSQELHVARELANESTPVRPVAPPLPRPHVWGLARLAGGDPDLLADFPSARFRYQTVGGLMLSNAALMAVATAMVETQAGGHTAVAWIGGLLFGALVLLGERILVQRAARSLRTAVLRRFVAAAGRVVLTILLIAVVSTPVILVIFAPQIDHQLAGAGAHAGVLARVNALQSILNEDTTARLAAGVVQGLFAIITALPPLAAVMPTSYDLMLEVKERYAPREVELQKIHQVAAAAAVPETATTEEVAAVRTELAEFDKRLTMLEAKITEEKEAMLASVTDLATKRNRRAS